MSCLKTYKGPNPPKPDFIFGLLDCYFSHFECVMKLKFKFIQLIFLKHLKYVARFGNNTERESE